MDRINFEKNETLMNVDTLSGDFCLAGRAVGVDPTARFNRLVVFTYRSLGTITKANDTVVNGKFEDVELTLTIEELTTDEERPFGCDKRNPGDPESRCEFKQTIPADCRLKGGLQKKGKSALTTITCDVGRKLSAFDLDPVDDADRIENVKDAFLRRKNLTVNLKKGKIRFVHRGTEAPDGLTVPLTSENEPPGC